MTSVSARPVGVGYCFSGARCQPRSRVRVSAAASAVAAPAPAMAATMYELLAVEETAGPDEIKAAYRRAARRWHPDACPGGADRFMAAREAYEVLSDPERRRGYDIQLRCGAHFGDAGYRAARRAGFADWEAQLTGLQWRAAGRRGRAGRETWGSRMRRAAAQPSL
jgi:curved DNA-binding protein CbpA